VIEIPFLSRSRDPTRWPKGLVRPQAGTDGPTKQAMGEVLHVDILSPGVEVG